MENIENKKLIIAHRGASGCAKENTLEAFQEAVERGADMVEFDVRRAGDGALVVIHDQEIGGRKIGDLTYEALNNISKDLGFHVPRLEEALALLKGKIKLDVELKEAGYEAEVIAQILKYFSQEDLIVTSFKKNSLRAIKNKYPEIKTGLLLGGRGESGKIIPAYFDGLFKFKNARKLGVDYVLPQWPLAILPVYLKKLRRTGVAVIVWTTANKKMAKKFFKNQNVSGVITDYPELLAEENN